MSDPPVPMDPAEAKEKFELFVFEMSDAIEDLRKWAARAASVDAAELDLTVPSLDCLEQLYANVLDGEVEPDTEWDIFNSRVARYFGETFRRAVGGKWKLETNERALSFGLPGIGDVPGADPAFIWSPFMVLNNYRGGRQSGLLRSSVEYYVSK